MGSQIGVGRLARLIEWSCRRSISAWLRWQLWIHQPCRQISSSCCFATVIYPASSSYWSPQCAAMARVIWRHQSAEIPLLVWTCVEINQCVGGISRRWHCRAGSSTSRSRHRRRRRAVDGVAVDRRFSANAQSDFQNGASWRSTACPCPPRRRFPSRTGRWATGASPYRGLLRRVRVGGAASLMASALPLFASPTDGHAAGLAAILTSTLGFSVLERMAGWRRLAGRHPARRSATRTCARAPKALGMKRGEVVLSAHHEAVALC